MNRITIPIEAVETKEFDGVTMVNATRLAESQGKRAKDYLRTDQSKLLISALKSTNGQIPPMAIDGGELTRNGRSPQTVWMNEDLLYDFAMWISVEFKIACIQVLKGKLGQKPISLPDFSNPVLAARAWADKAEENQMLEAKIESDKPKVEFANTTLRSDADIHMNVALKAAQIPIGTAKVYAILRRQGHMGSAGKNYNLPSTHLIREGHFVVKESNWEHPEKGVQVNQTAMARQSGIDWLSKWWKRYQESASLTQMDLLA